MAAGYKLATYQTKDGPRAGLVVDDKVVDAAKATGKAGYASVLGILSDNALTFVTPLFRYPEFDRRVAFVNAELERIRAIPGVISAGAISRIPLTVNDQTTGYFIDGQSAAQARGQDAL